MVSVLIYCKLSSSETWLGWPPTIYISTASFFLNRAIRCKYCIINLSWNCVGWQQWIKTFYISSSACICFSSYIDLFTGYYIRKFFKKLYSTVFCVGLLYNIYYRITGIWLNSNFWLKICCVAAVILYTKSRKLSIVNWIYLYSNWSDCIYII